MSKKEETKPKKVNQYATMLLCAAVLALIIIPFASADTSGGGASEIAASCNNSQYATGENLTGNFQCKQIGYQELTNTPNIQNEIGATCPIMQYAVNESSNGSFQCASASNTNYLTTQTAVTTEIAGGCTQLNLYATTESANGNINCARVNQGFNQTGLNLYAQLDEGSGSTIYDLSKNHVIGSAANSPAWLSGINCIFNQFCLGFTASANHTVSLGHSYDDHLSDPITMCIWFLATNTPTTSYNLFGDLTSAGTNGFQMQFNQNSTFSFSRTASAGIIFVTTTSTFPTNHWHFVCGTYDGHKDVILVDGLFQKSVADGNAMMGLPVTYMLGNTPRGVQLNTNYLTGRLSTFYQYQQALDNSSVLALYEYVPNPTEQNFLYDGHYLTTQTAVSTELAAGCAGGQAVTTESANGGLGCGAFLTAQTSAFFSYGACPTGQYATAITTTTLNCGNDNINFQNNTKTCSDTTSGTIHQAGFKLNYTAVGTGKVTVSIAWQISSPATSGINSKYRIDFGTGNAPACNGVAAGSTIGNQFEFGTMAAVAAFIQPEITVGQLTLTVGTTYWFDIQISDSTGATWIYSNPQMTVLES